MSFNTNTSTAGTTGLNAGNQNTTAAGSSVTGGHTSAHIGREDGGVVDAVDPRKGAGSHVPHSGNNVSSNTHGTHDTIHSSNPLSSNTHSSIDPTGPTHSNAPLGSGTGATHGTYPPTGTHTSDHPTGRAGSPTMGSKFPIGNKDGTNSTAGTISNTATDARGASHGTGTTHGTTGPHSSVAGGARIDTHPKASHGMAETHKPTMGEKVKGTVETMVGKVTNNPAKVAEGQDLKTGQHAHPAGDAHSAHPSTTNGGPHSTTNNTAGHSTAPGTHNTTSTHPGSNVDNVHHDKHAGFAKEHTSTQGAGTLSGSGTGL